MGFMERLKIGITGQAGFIGSYLFDSLSLLKEEFLLIPFDKTYFQQEDLLIQWVKKCDVVVHLAAMNRHPDANVVADTNILLVQKLVKALKDSGHNPHVLFSSSTQESRGNTYGDSKKTGRELLAAWAEKNGAPLTGMIIPNVFGPFGKPFYNSFVATFCHQLCNNEQPNIDVDSEVKLIYVGELVDEIIRCIRDKKNDPSLEIEYTSSYKVSYILEKLKLFKQQYLDSGIFPMLDDTFSLNLFNTFRSYINLEEHYPFYLKKNEDDRGVFVELVKLHQGGQVSFSTTHTGVTRGNHFHTRKVERFAVIGGKALIQLRRYNTDRVYSFELDGAKPSFVDMPIWYTHNIQNIGPEALYTVFWINEFFNPEDPDTYFETV